MRSRISIAFLVAAFLSALPGPHAEAQLPDLPIGIEPGPNDPPVASNVSISGTTQVGQVLTGIYDYADAEGDDEGASTFRWFRHTHASVLPIDGATAKTYTLGAVDVGALISFQITPVVQRSGPIDDFTISPGPPTAAVGLPVTSPAVGPVMASITHPPTASNVLITGTPQVGQVLTGSFSYADAEGDLEGASAFRWIRHTDLGNVFLVLPIDGATAQTYTLGAADQGALVSFEVTPVAQSGISPGLAVQSAEVGPVAAPPDAPPVASSVLISGTAQVGQVLTGSFAYADPENDPQGASTFRWLRGTTPIDGATAPTYTLVAADQGETVSFEVTPVAQSGTSPGLPVRSAAAGPVAAALDDPPVASVVRITGTPQVGQVLTGSFAYADAENDPQGVSTFRWLRGTTSIARATARTYTLVAADQGATVSFEVTPVAQTGTSPGRPIVSAAVGPVAPPINLPPTASNVLITGTADIGQVLTGSYTYTDAENDPEGTSLFRWLRDGTPVAGATAETYTLVVADQGAMVSFEVTRLPRRAPRRG
jgi:large repetitive protein